MQILSVILSLWLLFPVLSYGCDELDPPEEEVKFPVPANGITTASVQSALDEVKAIYAPRMRKLGIKLELNNLWWNTDVNASARAAGDPYGSLRIINICGGLARHRTVNLDVITMVACHEVGHVLGGYPGYRRHGLFKIVEGQADYFASLRCFKQVMKNKDNVAYMRGKKLPKAVVDLCAISHKTVAERALCQRNALAGYQTMLYVWQSTIDEKPQSKLAKPNFQTKSDVQVEKTLAYYPDLSCRVETHVRGAACNKPLGPYLKTDDAWDENVCVNWGDERHGARPSCWFAQPQDL